LAPVPNDRVRVERVASRLLAHSGRDVLSHGVRSRRKQVRNQSRDLVVAEGGEREPQNSAALQLGQRGAQLIRRQLTRLTPARHQEHRCGGKGARQMAQKQEGRRFGPLEIVEHEHEPSAGRNPRQEVCHRFERQKSLSRVVRLSGWGSGGYSSKKARTQSRQLAPASGHVLAQQVDVGMIDAGAEDRAERFEGYSSLIRGTPEDGDVHPFGGPRQLAEQRRLSHACFTRHECAAQARPGHQRQLAEQCFALSRSTHEEIAPRELSWDRKNSRTTGLFSSRS
jgi:hypothetical protein